MTASTSRSHKAIDLRKNVKKKKPRFRRHESWRYKRLKDSWRKPRGLDNKMKQERKGWPKSVKIGYGGPRIARNLHPSGYKEVLVHNPDEAASVNPETQAIRIAHTRNKKADYDNFNGERKKNPRFEPACERV